MYMPRNDDNFVRIGDCYELFYWGRGLLELIGGRKMAEKTFFCHMTGYHRELCSICMTVPVGEEELIFHMEDGKQVFVSDCKD